MSKTKDVSTLDHRPLADSELDAVSGGGVVSVIDGLSKALSKAASAEGGTPLVWVGCAWVPQWW